MRGLPAARMKRRNHCVPGRLAAAATALLAGLVSGCHRPDAPSPAGILGASPKTPGKTSALKLKPKATPLPISHRVTGMPLPRALAVMVENHPAARPQSGLDQADVVYEALSEGGITRYLAIYWSDNAPVIGPIRSARPHFIELMEAYNPVYVHCGQSWAAEKMLAERMPSEINELKDKAPFWRDTTRRRPHNLYASTASLWQEMERKGLAVGSVAPTFFDQPLPGGKSHAQVRIPYPYGQRYSVSYRYDADRDLYLRSVNGSPHRDRRTSEQLAARTVIVQETTTRPMGTKHGELAIEVVGSGRCWVARHGRWLRGFWRKDAPEVGTVYTTETGARIPSAPGPTWIQVLPEGGRPTFSSS